jgi:hypothetical protein
VAELFVDWGQLPSYEKYPAFIKEMWNRPSYVVGCVKSVELRKVRLQLEGVFFILISSNGRWCCWGFKAVEHRAKLFVDSGPLRHVKNV